MSSPVVYPYVIQALLLFGLLAGAGFGFLAAAFKVVLKALQDDPTVNSQRWSGPMRQIQSAATLMCVLGVATAGVSVAFYAVVREVGPFAGVAGLG